MKNKFNVYEVITNRIIEALENGVVPWRKPWNSVAPQNFVSRKNYRGINHLLLSMSEYESPYWMTFKQAKDLGGMVRKGEKATMVVFWSFIDMKDKEGKKTDEKIPMARYYNVFNFDQTEGIEAPKTNVLEFTPVERCEEIIAGYVNKPKITKSDSAWYMPLMDKVGVPAKSSFVGIGEYYFTLFHELVHSTGHVSRLNRPDLMSTERFGSDTYSKEELVAELGASFLALEGGIDCKQLSSNSASYISGWLGHLKGNKKDVISAASQAQKAVDLILSRGEEVHPA